MNILHLTIGIPSYRSGGLTNYSFSLAKMEAELGHTITILYPGNVRLLDRRTSIKEKAHKANISIYKIVNPAFVPIPFGVREPGLIMKKIPRKVYQDFLDGINPNLVHVHTFMGFTIELFEELHKRKIPMLYTTHDYYALCPKGTLIDADGRRCEGATPNRCACCNSCASNSMILQYILQSEWYPMVKNSRLVMKLKENRKNFVRKKTGGKEKGEEKTIICDSGMIEEYERFLAYQRKMLEFVDVIHCNSSASYGYYHQALPDKRMFIQNITTDGVKDNRKDVFTLPYKNNGYLTFGYIGIRDYHKGFWILRDAAAILHRKGYPVKAVFYGDEFDIDLSQYPFCDEKGTFDHKDIRNVMRGMDILVVPGFWWETFGFTALEAIANGVPVLISTRTGAKDLLDEIDTPHLFEPTPEHLAFLMERYIKDTSLIEKAQIGQSHLHPTFSMKSHTVELLDEVAQNVSLAGYQL